MPPYPLYGETAAIPGASQGASTLHTHSNKFPIEREVILSSADKNTKIPILQEYRRREGNRAMAAIAPDAPSKLVAWGSTPTSSHIQLPETPLRPHQTYLTAYSGGPHTGAVPRTYDVGRGKFMPGEIQLATPLVGQLDMAHDQTKTPMSNHGPADPRHYPAEMRDEKITIDHASSIDALDGTKKDPSDPDKNKAFSTRTYQTLKGMISSRFNKKEASELNKSSTSLVESNTLNNMEKEVNKSLDNGVKDEENSHNEGAYARLSGMGSMGVVYAKVLDQGQCSIPMESKSSDSIHATNQAVYAERTAAGKPPEMVKSPSYPDRSYRSPSTSQYAKPNTQHSDQTGIYMVMRQGGPQYSATNPTYSGQNGISESGKIGQHTPIYSPQHYKPQTSTPNMYPGHTAGHLQHPPSHPPSHPPAHPPSHPPAHPPSHPPMHPPSHPPAHPPSHPPMHPPAHPPALPPSHPPSHPAGHPAGSIGPGLTYHPSPKTTEPTGYYAREDAAKKPSEEKGKKAMNGGFRKSKLASSGVGSGSGQSSDYDKTNVDSGRGSAVSGQQMTREVAETSEESSTTPQGNDSEWVDLVESELRQILDPHVHHQAAAPAASAGNNSTVSDSISSMTPPLPPLSPGGGANNSSRYKLTHNASGVYGIKQDYGPIDGRKTSQSQGRGNMSSRFNWSKTSDRNKSTLLGQSMMGGSVTDITSTTGTGLDSLLDDDVATSIATGDARAIRHQLEGLENMYSQVLQLLGVKRQGMKGQGYQPSDPRFNKRRFHGSVSSVPSSVSSRPIREKRRQDERKKVKDIKGINKRFQRLESHVVTLARSVAHLSSEMRTQHLMIQEMENIRSELSALRSHTLAATSRSQSMPRLSSALSSLPALTNPMRVKKLTKFFGDEPPLLRLFLKKLGYEKYAGIFESEHVGMVELPYMSEDKLQSMGIPLGPRLRILQEAHVSVLTTDQLCVL